MLNVEEIVKQYTKKKVNAFLVVQDGKIIKEYYKKAEDAIQLHKINSITKSITAALIGIAIDKGYILNIETPLNHFFPTLPENKRSLTLYHLLTMTTGEKWEEFGNGSGVRFPSFFVKSKNWTQYVLKRPLLECPGIKMNYNSGSSHLLSVLLQNITGMSTRQFAQQYLFSPLGITQYEWEQDPQGVYIGGFSMRMKTKDMLKIGRLFLQNGNWEGRQIISSDWIRQSTIPHFKTYEHIGSYGFHWWVLDRKKFDVPMDMYLAMGYGGQYIIVVPELNLTAAISSYMPRSGLIPLRIFIDNLKQ